MIRGKNILMINKIIRTMMTSKMTLVKEYYLIIVRFFISLKKTLTGHPGVIFFQNFEFHTRLLSRRNPVINYFYKLFSTIIEAGLLMAATGILCVFIFYTMNMLWHLYIGTPMGEKFAILYPERAQTIMQLAGLDLTYFCIEITLSTFVISFALAATCQFIHVTHYFYLSRGFFGKLIWWGAPLTGMVSYYIKGQYGLSSWETTAGIVMLPTYLMFMNCFKYSQKLIPEAGDIVNFLRPRIKQSYQFVYIKIIGFTKKI